MKDTRRPKDVTPRAKKSAPKKDKFGTASNPRQYYRPFLLPVPSSAPVGKAAKVSHDPLFEQETGDLMLCMSESGGDTPFIVLWSSDESTGCIALRALHNDRVILLTRERTFRTDAMRLVEEIDRRMGEPKPMRSVDGQEIVIVEYPDNLLPNGDPFRLVVVASFYEGDDSSVGSAPPTEPQYRVIPMSPLGPQNDSEKALTNRNRHRLVEQGFVTA